MTNGEIRTIENIVARLKERNCGCSNGFGSAKLVEEANGKGMEVVSRLYLDSWIIPALEALLPGEGRDVELAQSLSR